MKGGERRIKNIYEGNNKIDVLWEGGGTTAADT